MTKNHVPTENSKTNGQHKNATQKFDYTTIADRLGRSVWVTIPVYGYPTFNKANSVHELHAALQPGKIAGKYTGTLHYRNFSK